MSQSLVILGRQPALGLAELESLLGPDKIQPLGSMAALIDCHHSEVPFGRLGGSIKLAKLLHEFPNPSWAQIEKYLLENLPKHLHFTDKGSKLTVGLSLFGLKVSVKQLLRTGLSIKKVLKNAGKSVRIVPNKDAALNSAQVRSNKLYGPNGWELIFIQNGSKIIMGLTVHEQDIDAYAARDHGRPKRDSQVGMLPPKLAQIIINLAKPPQDGIVLDPFCGTGVILQEARLMGYSAVGTDLDERMVEYTKINMEWLSKTFQPPGKRYTTEVADATKADWPDFNSIAAETYLGRPFSHEPDPETLKKVMQDTDTIHQKFIANVARQTKAGFRMCIAVPAWFTKSGVKHLKTLDSLEKLGYNRLSFTHAENKDLIYHRQGQIVGRELVVLKRK